MSYIENDGQQRVEVKYDNTQIKLINSQVENFSTIALYWMNSTINYQNNKIDNIIATTRYPSISPLFTSDQTKMNINRSTEGKLKSIINDDISGFTGLYLQFNTEVISYDVSGLPNKIMGKILPIEDVQYPLSLSWDFAFKYIKANDVPKKLKRLINEELIFSNRYGVTNYDMFYIDSTRNFSQLGEGNWLISFGLPEYYILEDKSSYLVSKRTTNYYKGGIKENGDPDGSREYFKTKIEDFPYIHDAEAKTLEIAGLKIWYEFVE